MEMSIYKIFIDCTEVQMWIWSTSYSNCWLRIQHQGHRLGLWQAIEWSPQSDKLRERVMMVCNTTLWVFNISHGKSIINGALMGKSSINGSFSIATKYVK